MNRSGAGIARGAELGTQRVVEVAEIGVVERIEVGERDLAVRGREPVGERAAVGGGEATDEHGVRDPLGTGVDGGPRHAAAGGMAHQQDRRVTGVDGGDDRVDGVPERHRRPVGIGRHAGQGERVGGVAGGLQVRGDAVPRRSVEPQARHEHDVHRSVLPALRSLEQSTIVE